VGAAGAAVGWMAEEKERARSRSSEATLYKEAPEPSSMRQLCAAGGTAAGTSERSGGCTRRAASRRDHAGSGRRTSSLAAQSFRRIDDPGERFPS
jgi:hypothetical protein